MPGHRYVERYNVFLRSGLFMCLLLLLTACGGTTSQSQQATPGPLVAFNLGIPQAALTTQTVGQVPDSTMLHVIVTFKPNDQLLNQLGQTPVTQAGQGTDVASLANQLGITDEQYQQIKQFFAMQGATLELNKLHTALTINAPAGSFAKQLHTTFVYHEYQGRKFFAPASPLMLPQNIVQHIVAISGLDNYSKPPAMGLQPAQQLAPAASHGGCFPYSTNTTDYIPDLSSAQVASAYGFDKLYALGWTGKGVTIILPEFATFDHSSLATYFSCVHYRGHVQYINVDNDAPVDDSVEPLLDIEMVAGLLPDATIVVYQTENTWPGFIDTINQIASDYSNNHAATEVSISWGLSETEMDMDTVNALQAGFRILSQAEHINTFAASGDCGAYDSEDYPHTRDVNYPASDPYVLGVGGTQLTINGAQQRSKEEVWVTGSDSMQPYQCENSWGSGGGLSTLFKRPSWQQAPGVQNTYSNGYREVPDISAVATYLAIYDGSWESSGGTSAATPIWASAFGQINEGIIATKQSIVSGNSIFYQSAQSLWNTPLYPYYDVQHGNNLYYPATSGFDDATGLGSPNIMNVYQSLLQYISKL